MVLKQDPENKTPLMSLLTPAQMEQWNEFGDWLKSKGLEGDKRLNKLDFSKRIFEQYKSENPSTEISYDLVGRVQESVKKYREDAIKSAKEGKLKLDSKEAGADFENFMPWANKTKVDGHLGEFTSKFRFPSWYISDKYTKSGMSPETYENQGLLYNAMSPITSIPPQTAQKVASRTSYGQYRRLPN
jgi:hypothetical protein